MTQEKPLPSHAASSICSAFPALLFAMFTMAGTAQAGPVWSKIFSLGIKSESEARAVWTSDGAIMVAGTTNSIPTGRNHFYAMRLGPDGKLQWQVPLPAHGNVYPATYSESFHGIAPTPDGGAVLVGECLQPTGDVNGCVLRLTAGGSIAWQRTYGSNGHDRHWAVQELPGGQGYIVAGDTTSFGATQDVWLLKLDQLGNILEERLYSLPGQQYIRSVDAVPSGGFAVAGFTSTPTPAALVIRVDDFLAPLWARAFDGPFVEEAYSIKATPDGHLYVVGQTNSFPINANYDNAFALKLSDTNPPTIDWQKIYDSEADEFGRGIAFEADGNLLMAANRTSRDNSTDFWLVPLFPDTGEISSCKAYDSQGPDQLDRIWSVVPSPDGGFVVAGDLSKPCAPMPCVRTDSDFWLMKVDFKGYVDASCPFYEPTTASLDATFTMTTLLFDNSLPQSSVSSPAFTSLPWAPIETLLCEGWSF